MSDIVLKQFQYYAGEECRKAIQALESQFVYTDETEYFSNLVNFSTAKSEPYQRWVRYREGYSTALVDELIKRSNLDSVHQCVADPMVGSGTTIIAARKAGFDAFGIDINPYCKTIVDTKLLDPTEDQLTEVDRFLNDLPTEFDSYSGNYPPLSDYFPKNNVNDLLSLKSRIERVNEKTVKQILMSCWFFILEQCSNRKKDGNGLATRVSPVEDVIRFYKDTVRDVTIDYSLHPLPHNVFSQIYTGSACDFSKYSSVFEKLCGKRLGAIIFSPPYANAFDYFESYKMELLFGELYSQTDYQHHKKEQIRNYRISYGREIACEYPIVELLCKEIFSAIPKKEQATGKRDARTRLMPNMLRGYFNDMGQVLYQLYAALENNGDCYLVVDQSAYAGVIVPTDVILASIAAQHGFVVDNIIICRKAATSGQQRKAYPYLGETLRESIICLKKTAH